MPATKLKVDIISDVVCPWCVIGYRRLKTVLDKLGSEVDVSLHWHPFELNLDMAKEGENLRAHLAAKYGTTLEGSIKARAMLTEEGKKVGFTFNYFDEMKMLNTHDCHQLLLSAAGTSLQTKLAEALFEHFFTNRGEFDHASLIEIAKQVGMSTVLANEILAEQALSAQVHAIEEQWQQQGIRGVPLFIFNDKHPLSGAQSADVFDQLITSIIE